MRVPRATVHNGSMLLEGRKILVTGAAKRIGRTIALRVPGGGDMLLYQPRHPTAFDL